MENLVVRALVLRRRTSPAVPFCPNKNDFSSYLNWLCDKPGCRQFLAVLFVGSSSVFEQDFDYGEFSSLVAMSSLIKYVDSVCTVALRQESSNILFAHCVLQFFELVRLCIMTMILLLLLLFVVSVHHPSIQQVPGTIRQFHWNWIDGD